MLVFTLLSVPFTAGKVFLGDEERAPKAAGSPNNHHPGTSEGQDGMEGQGKGVGLDKNIFTEDPVLFAPGLCWVANNFVCAGETQVIDYPSHEKWGALGEQHPTIQCFTQSACPVLCVSFSVLGSCLCFFFHPGECGSGDFAALEAVAGSVTANSPPACSERFRDKSSFSV